MYNIIDFFSNGSFRLSFQSTDNGIVFFIRKGEKILDIVDNASVKAAFESEAKNRTCEILKNYPTLAHAISN